MITPQVDIVEFHCNTVQNIAYSTAVIAAEHESDYELPSNL